MDGMKLSKNCDQMSIRLIGYSGRGSNKKNEADFERARVKFSGVLSA